ncbi:ABC transporter substrate-binding protein [Streptomyces sp. NPDC050560]|uniref:ABC transporter substrate-binding protein n=1 Tax=Streptomyces sp. NPDC050560 TaxID=3365630 RepID=UPI0037B4138A
MGVGTVAVALVSLVSGCSDSDSDSPSSASADVEVSKINMGAIEGADWAWLYVGVDSGIFKKNGLDVTISTPSPSTIPAAVMRGSLQASAQVGTCERAHGEGVKVIDVGVAGIRDSHTLLARKGIGSVKGLAGKTLIVPQGNSSPTARIKAILKEQGVLDDVKLLPVAAANSQVALFKSGQGDAIWEPIDVIAKTQKLVSGSDIVLDSKEAGQELPNTGLCISEAFLKKNPKTSKALIKSMVQSVQFLLKGSPDAMSSMEKQLKLTSDEADLTLATLHDDLTSDPVVNDTLLTAQADQDSKSSGKKVTLEQVRTAYDMAPATQVAGDLGTG